METRSQSRAKEGQSSSLPVTPLEDSVLRPSSRASGSEGDLGLTTLLGEGDALIVGRGRALESATSGSWDATLVAGQDPASEPVSVSTQVQVTADNLASTSVVTDTTTVNWGYIEQFLCFNEPWNISLMGFRINLFLIQGAYVVLMI